MKIVTADTIAKLDFNELLKDAQEYLESDLRRWQEFNKTPRHGMYYDHGVCELMPCADNQYYTYKYVNCHPGNPEQGKLSVAALGMLADVATGYPQMMCDMTLLTAVRTAAIAAIAAKHLAPKDSSVLGIIGTGAQSEFQTTALLQQFPLTEIRYYDRDKAAMEKYARNFEHSGVTLVPCKDGNDVVRSADIITTCICEKGKVKLFGYESVAGRKVHINAIGGDCPGKTELDPRIMENSRIVVEFYPQTKVEGEIQNIEGDVVHDELWEIVQGKKPGRTDDDLITVFDAVGFALADYSVLRLLYEKGIGSDTPLLPDPEDPKNLFATFNTQAQTRTRLETHIEHPSHPQGL